MLRIIDKCWLSWLTWVEGAHSEVYLKCALIRNYAWPISSVICMLVFLAGYPHNIISVCITQTASHTPAPFEASSGCTMLNYIIWHLTRWEIQNKSAFGMASYHQSFWDNTQVKQITTMTVTWYHQYSTVQGVHWGLKRIHGILPPKLLGQHSRFMASCHQSFWDNTQGSWHLATKAFGTTLKVNRAPTW